MLNKIGSTAFASSPCFFEVPLCQIGRLDPELRCAHVAECEFLVHRGVTVYLQKQDGSVSTGVFSGALDVFANAEHLMQRAMKLLPHLPASKVEFMNIFAWVCSLDGVP